MSTFRRFGVGLITTVALMVAGLIYNRVFTGALLPLVDPEGTFSTPVVWLDNIVPVVIVMILLATWVWVIAGVAKNERAVENRRVRR